MKDWFPFTNYDFYAYLTTGMIVVASVDHSFLNSSLANQQHWTLAAGVFWAATAYLVGHIIAMPSSAILEHVLARRVLLTPTDILLGMRKPRFRERAIAALTGAREYQPFPKPNRDSIIAKVATSLHTTPRSVTSEAAFQVAFPYARSVPDTASRLDNFLNQYGLCRNASFAAAVAACIILIGNYYSPQPTSGLLALAAVVIAVGLFCRFLKFYAAYAREVFRTYDKVVARP